MQTICPVFLIAVKKKRGSLSLFPEKKGHSANFQGQQYSNVYIHIVQHIKDQDSVWDKPNCGHLSGSTILNVYNLVQHIKDQDSTWDKPNCGHLMGQCMG
eukprot:TRINITY_DN986_c0_g2_i1.p2 TRINITY_DN986_c0_g2~~TRINITY_DN986_c0_g2_i1.p2  ORF type:complete len:100 (-),score=11.00 TRINITY_DN986_c0_g2_i1:436-735(-)